ncbi:hypothetical protein QWY77_00625 [Thalassotalea ponticola]|uniref:hypothetical protein n=1 Tax=Thalassotalea ponticola TaxID=1523392 RepID=UPI0025B36C22|nr:hypothetical protein [Thalassotalea ponticola]MDN3651288.1 hypothetical protein [Thalassotalea ponticola]
MGLQNMFLALSIRRLKTGVSNGQLMRVFGGVALAFNTSISSAYDDDVYLATLSNNDIITVVNVSDRDGYDNQPHFAENDTVLLYTAMYDLATDVHADGDSSAPKRQTDSMRYDIEQGTLVNLTNSVQSEYSPTITPDGDHVSVIRVAEDGRQLMYRFAYGTDEHSAPSSNSSNRQGKPVSGEVLLGDTYDVGYHTWLNNDELLLFVLGEKMQLKRARVSSGETALIDTDIGRTLRKVAVGDALDDRFSYTKAVDGQWQLKVYHRDLKSVSKHTVLPGANMYYAWHPNGSLLSADGAKVMINANWQVETVPASDTQWQQFADFSQYCSGHITRMVMSQDASKLAFVCSVKDNQ